MTTRIASPRSRRLLLAIAVGAALLVSSAPALGATPTPYHVNFSESYEDVVCGIAVDVIDEGQWTNTEFVQRDGSYLFRGTAYLSRTYTAANGTSVVVIDANQLTFSDPVIDEEAGTITFVNTLRGVLEKMKLADGQVLFVDAGYAIDAITFDLETEEFVSFESIRFHGRSELGASGFTLWCQAFIAALG
jgi:hypothetical protein